MESANCGGAVSGVGGQREEEKKHTAVVGIGSIHTTEAAAGEKERHVDNFSSREMESLAALCDTFLPSVDVPNDVVGVAGEPSVKLFKTSAAKAGTPHHVVRLIRQRMRFHVILLRVALILLSTRIGTLILGGRASLSSHFPFFHKFSDLSLQNRQKMALSWSTSRFTDLRVLFVGMKSLILHAFFTQVDDDKKNPYWEAIGYCGPDPDFRTTQVPKEPSSGKDEPNSGPLKKGIVNMSNPREVVVQTLRWVGFQVSDHKRNPSRAGPYDDLANPSLTIRCDAVVVGSGSGGSVVAGELAKAGYKVLVLEKGSYIARSNLSLLEGQSLTQMYEAGGLLPTKDAGISILAGSTIGGGSTINWSASIKTPNHVRREWSEAYDLELFDSKLYQEALDSVCEKMGVQSDIEEEGLNNEVLRKGCMELGYPVQNMPRNAPKDHYCGWCCMGCKDGRKKGTTETWLRDLVESNNGVILPDCKALKVLYSKGSGCRGKAKGVAFEFNYKGAKEVCIVESKVTVVACGALNTPALLRKSGLKNPNIGKHLHLHPAAMAWGVFPERSSEWLPDNGKRSYEGGIMTSMSPVVANFEGSGYGALIQTPSLHPGLFSVLMPWTSGIDIKIRMSKFSRTATLLAITRDKGSGEIISHNAQDIRYRLADTDTENLSAALEKMLRILVAAGAEEIGTHHRGGATLNAKKASSHELERFIKSARKIEKRAMMFASAHQMGSCRMGVDPRTSAVDPRAESWEVEALFLADTSVFPTALGVNPMVTVMAISYCTAQSVLEVLKRKRGWH